MGSGFKFIDGASTVDFLDFYVSRDLILNTPEGLWGWGRNDWGQFGNGNTVSTNEPVASTNSSGWKSFDCGYYHTLAIKNNGTLWAWGYNNNGELGQGDVIVRSSPVQIGAFTNWKQISSNNSFSSAAIKTDGTLWTWGNNDYGQLAAGEYDSGKRSSPLQVGSDTNWNQVSISGHNGAAVKTDGTLWTWGNDSDGQLGINVNGGYCFTPIQVGTLTDWKCVETNERSVCAIKTDGTLWTWGLNTLGQLGHNDRTSRSSPVQVGTLTNWKQVSVGKNHTLAIKTDGTLWGWGRNDWGQLGIGLSGAAHRSSPVQIGTLTNWKTVDCGENVVAAIKIDGTLWTWGYNDNGQLGYGYLQSMSSPVQVSALSKWKQVSASSYFMIGQKK